MKRKNMYIALASLIASAVLLLLCSQCSPLYPTNVWPDANCLLTVGRVMKEGGVVYRDIYEQKGPTLYLIHALAACISDGSFLGVYVMEVLSFAAVLYLTCLMSLRRKQATSSFCDALLIGAFVLTGSAFFCGDSAEEFCLPYLMGTLYLVFGHYDEHEEPMPAGAMFICGLMAGMVATIKFTILGFFVGLCVAEGVCALRRDGFVRALKSALAFLAGMLLPIGAWCVYFASHGALSDFYRAYVYNNIFLYSDETRTLMSFLRAIWNTLRGNLIWVLAAVLWLLGFASSKKEKLQLRACVLCMAAGTFAAVFLLGRTWTYSPLVLCVFAFSALRSLGSGAPQFEGSASARRIGAVFFAVLTLILAWLSPNAHLRGEKMENLAQARLGAYVHEGATVLQYSHLDDGLYLATGTLPPQKYFVRLNVRYDEMIAELDRYVEEAIPDYVLTSWEPLDARFDRYQLIAQDAGYDDAGRINKAFYLYRRK
ncbi:MAG: hypothetical protein IKJ11_07965 [Clostridia bacterium]|nr:hypothetical protein [Clostridia bacterium]